MMHASVTHFDTQIDALRAVGHRVSSPSTHALYLTPPWYFRAQNMPLVRLGVFLYSRPGHDHLPLWQVELLRFLSPFDSMARGPWLRDRCVYVCVYMYVCMYVCMCVYMYVYMRAPPARPRARALEHATLHAYALWVQDRHAGGPRVKLSARWARLSLWCQCQRRTRPCHLCPGHAPPRGLRLFCSGAPFGPGQPSPSAEGHR